MLHTHPEGDRRVADRWSNELAAADEDCVQSGILSNEGNKVITDREWSPDGTMIGLSAEEYDPAANTLTHSGIYLADVVYTGNRPTGVTNFRQVVETSGNTALDWSPDSGKVVYGGAELRITSKTTTGSPVNVQACYSPVGQYLSFASGTYPSLNAPAGDRVLYRIKADGSGKPIRIIGAKGQS